MITFFKYALTISCCPEISNVASLCGDLFCSNAWQPTGGANVMHLKCLISKSVCKARGINHRVLKNKWVIV